jgi:hypothetical protein
MGKSQRCPVRILHDRSSYGINDDLFSEANVIMGYASA